MGPSSSVAISSDLTLDELRIALAPAIADAAVFDGWTALAVANAAASEGVDPEVAKFAFKAEGTSLPMTLIATWIAAIDRAMGEALPMDALAPLKIRERIRVLVLFRLDAAAGQEESLRRALAIQSLPQNLARTARIAWRSADQMWRLAGDTATDYNHYTKRLLLAGIYTATLAVFIDDESEGKVETRAFLDRRIDEVMKFEKVKTQFLRPDAERFSPARLLGRLRYPAR